MNLRILYRIVKSQSRQSNVEEYGHAQTMKILLISAK